MDKKSQFLANFCIKNVYISIYMSIHPTKDENRIIDPKITGI